ncbi:hypothetical protein [Vreelandella massiliensis]|uniref:hypothetical protein n=1 Tax=Vreelandella massiliensis TaxID=1816686 RepID=UPI00096A6EA1|nr:hypothetical protein [Halomonas massiliensis]
MTKPTTAQKNPLVQVANNAAIQLAEAQFRLARFFTPYSYDPKRIDYDRVAEFLDDVFVAFPQPTANLKPRLDDLQAQIAQHRQTLAALKDAGAEPDLTDEQLFITAQANVVNPSMAGYSRAA